MSHKTLFAFVCVLALGGCASIPQPLAGNYAPVSLSAARNGTATAIRVRWGGVIIRTEPRQQQTCFFILAKPLNSQARPERSDARLGRFIACKQGFYDPEVFRSGREITVTGTLDGTVIDTIGHYGYTYAKVNANTIYLWPRRPRYVASPYYYNYNVYGGWGYGSPYFGPWGWGATWYYSSPDFDGPRHDHDHHKR